MCHRFTAATKKPLETLKTFIKLNLKGQVWPPVFHLLPPVALVMLYHARKRQDKNKLLVSTSIRHLDTWLFF